MKVQTTELIMILIRLFKSNDIFRNRENNYLHYSAMTAKDFRLCYYVTGGKFFCEGMVRGEDGAWRYASRKNFW